MELLKTGVHKTQFSYFLVNFLSLGFSYDLVGTAQARIVKDMWMLSGSVCMFANFYRKDLHNETCII